MESFRRLVWGQTRDAPRMGVRAALPTVGGERQVVCVEVDILRMLAVRSAAPQTYLIGHRKAR